MMQMTMQLPDQLAAELLPAQRWLPLLLELGLARLETPARTTANEIITFLLGNPTSAELVRYHVSDRAQARLQRLLALNAAGLADAAEQQELDELQRIEHLLIKAKAQLAAQPGYAA